MAARFLDMALDDVAKSRASNNRSPGGRRGGRGGGNGGRDSPNRNNRSSPYGRSTPSDDRWTHDKYDGGASSGGSHRQQQQRPQSSEGNAKITVENLHYAVTLEDIKELFNTHAGPVKLAEVKYDLSGRSTGVATILFKEAASAAIAIKKLNDIALDGQPMKISYAPLPQSARVQDKHPAPRDTQRRDVFSRLGSSEADIASRLGKMNPVPRNTGAGGGSPAARQHNNTNKPTQQQQQKRQPKPQPKAKTAEELDAEMDTYMGEGTA